MKQLKESLARLISEEPGVDWLILHKLSQATNPTKHFKFSFVDGNERYDVPFKTHQGFISLNSPEAVKNFQHTIAGLTKDFRNAPIALANLYIVLCQASFSGEDEGALQSEFRSTVGGRDSRRVYDVLIESLNEQYFAHSHLAKETPRSTNEWLSMLRLHFHGGSFSDPLLHCLALVRTAKNRSLKFEFIESMSPMLRSMLVGWFSFGLHIPKGKQRELLKDDGECGFLAACLSDDLSTDIIPQWLTQKFISELVLNKWHPNGEQLFEHVYGLNYLNKNPGKLHAKVASYLHKAVYPQLTTASPISYSWIDSFKFPDDFIAVFGWIQEKKIKHSKVPLENYQHMLDRCFKELHRIADSVPTLMQSQNHDNPFRSFQLSESKYEMALAHFLMLFIHASEEQHKALRAVCMKYRILFYGNYRTERLAIDFSEILLLIVLSGYKCGGFSEENLRSIKKLLETIQDTILIPYIHLTERESEIWNVNDSMPVFEFDSGTYMVIHMLNEIKKSSLAATYEDFFKAIEEVKVAQWPYER
jgi:hypothetical protein